MVRREIEIECLISSPVGIRLFYCILSIMGLFNPVSVIANLVVENVYAGFITKLCDVVFSVR